MNCMRYDASPIKVLNEPFTYNAPNITLRPQRNLPLGFTLYTLQPTTTTTMMPCAPTFIKDLQSRQVFCLSSTQLVQL